MRRKLLVTVITLLTLLSISIKVQAEHVSSVLLDISLPEGFTRQTNLQNQSNIALYAINEAKDESVIVVTQENELTEKVINLNQLDEVSFNAFVEKYNEAKMQEGQSVLKQEKYGKDEMVFIDTVFEYTADDKKIQTEEYYTIINETAITISVSFLQKQVDSLKVREIIDSINIVDNTKMDFDFLAIPLVLVVLTLIYFVKERKNKVHLEDVEKKKVLQNVIDYMSKIDYSKFRGILILFAVTMGLNIVNLFFGIIEVITQNNWMQEYGVADKIYVILGILQNAVQLIGIIYIAYRLTKKEEKTIKKIKGTLIIMLIGVALLTVSRVIVQMISLGINENLIQYITNETQVLTRSAMNILIWYFYFKNSIRVSVYYKGKTLEQIIMEPKKGYQLNSINKKIMEIKIIEYFKNNKATDYASGIYINKLPKEYAKSLSLSDLNTKKIIRLKRAKYYLSNKDLENPKSERRKTIKTIISVSAIYLFVLLILYTI